MRWWSSERVVATVLLLLLLSTAPIDARVESAAQAGRVGFATYYARSLHGRMTASGIPFDQNDLVAAHPTYPFGTVVRVTNLENGRSVKVRIVDRGPAPAARGRGHIIDVSRAAAQALDCIQAGRCRVRLDRVSTE